MSQAKQIRRVNQEIKEITEKKKVVREIELFVLDNSLCESTVGQLRGHTIENKWKIYEEIKKVGFQHIIVASFSHMTRVGDTFCRQLAENGEDFSKLYAFTEMIQSVGKDRVPDTTTIPIGLQKMKKLGLRNVIIEFDLVYYAIDYDKFTSKKICHLLSQRMAWVRKNLANDAHIFINFRDFSDAMKGKIRSVLNIVNYLSSLPSNERPFGLMYEETGKYLPEEMGVWTAAVRREMIACGFGCGHLLVHVHEQWGLAQMTQLECIANGADGVWASLCEEGAAMGHASSSITMMNLIRLGNKRILEQYKCPALREAAQNITEITTGLPPHPKQPIYGERALDMVFGLPNFPPGKNEFDLAQFFGKEPVERITPLASLKMIVDKLTKFFGPDPQFTENVAQRMLEVMYEDLNQNRKEEYNSAVGLAILFDRSGGKLTSSMRDAIADEKATIGTRSSTHRKKCARCGMNGI